MDCVAIPGGYGGCRGGLPELAWQYIKDNRLSTEAEYPYAMVRWVDIQQRIFTNG